MSLQIETLEYLNENANRAFPIKAGQTQTSVSGECTIPNDLIVDLLCSIDSDISKEYHISKISVSDSYIVIEISNATEVVGTFTVNAPFTPNMVVFLDPAATYTGASGKLIIGSTSTLQSTSQGVFYFESSSTKLENRCFIPNTTGVDRIIFRDANGVEIAYTGAVSIQAGNNLRFNILSSTEVRLDAGDGIGLNAQCDKQQPILTINGVSPDADGNFVFDTSGCASLVEIPNGIRLQNDCTKPCMGCSEIAELLQRVMSVETNLLTLRSTYQALLSEYSALQQALSCSC